MNFFCLTFHFPLDCMLVCCRSYVPPMHPHVPSQSIQRVTPGRSKRQSATQRMQALVVWSVHYSALLSAGRQASSALHPQQGASRSHSGGKGDEDLHNSAAVVLDSKVHSSRTACVCHAAVGPALKQHACRFCGVCQRCPVQWRPAVRGVEYSNGSPPADTAACRERVWAHSADTRDVRS